MYKLPVHDNQNLADIQELTYIKGQVIDEAHHLIEGFKLETSDYQTATDLVHITFGELERIKTALITNLCDPNM